MQYRSLFAALVLSTAAQAGEVEEPTVVHISAERLKECHAGGGCAFVTQAEAKEAMERIWEKAFEAGKQFSHVTCGSRTKAWE
jgi:hypothetical protein